MTLLPAARLASPMVRQRGQVATEFLLVVVVLAAALCLPWLAGESPATLLLGALVGLSRAFQHWLSLL